MHVGVYIVAAHAPHTLRTCTGACSLVIIPPGGRRAAAAAARVGRRHARVGRCGAAGGAPARGHGGALSGVTWLSPSSPSSEAPWRSDDGAPCMWGRVMARGVRGGWRDGGRKGGHMPIPSLGVCHARPRAKARVHGPRSTLRTGRTHGYCTGGGGTRGRAEARQGTRSSNGACHRTQTNAYRAGHYRS